MNEALNLNAYNDFMSIELKKQFFEFGGFKDEKKSLNPWKIALIVVVPAAVIAIVIGFVIFLAKRKNPNQINENEMSAETRVLWLNESLLNNA